MADTPEVAYWLQQISSAQKRAKKWRDKARDAVKIYNGDRAATPFNIVYSNTETLVPAIYNEPPVPIVGARYRQDDPVADMASQVLERTLAFTRDNPVGGYENLHDLFASVVLASAVPGLGVAQFTYDADIRGYDAKLTIPYSDTSAGDRDGADSATAQIPPEGENSPPARRAPADTAPVDIASASPPEVRGEGICARVIPWDQFAWGYAKRWKDTPWRAVAWDMTRGDVETSFGAAWARRLPYSTQPHNDSDDEITQSDDQKRIEGTVRIWEIWHKSAREVLYLAEGWGDGLVHRQPDPLQLSNFFNIPDPLLAFERVGATMPQTLYAFYKTQAEELNRLTSRIEKITEALKVRGFYDASLKDMPQLFNQQDNALVPIDGVNALQNGGTLDKSIWLMPVNELANVLQTLLQAREQVKQVIYEITGISDILRGSSVASETATAQNIKNQWGSLRLKKYQKRVQNYVRECFRMIAEIAGEHFSEDTFAAMTGLQLTPTKEIEELRVLLPQAEAAAQMEAMQSPPGGAPPEGTPLPPSPGAPPGAAPPGPAAQQLQEIQQKLAQPSWANVLPLLRDDLNRAFKVDIETDSTIDPEAAQDRTAFGEMMQAVAAIVQQWMPAVQSQVITMPAFKVVLKAALKRFRFGPEVEAAINQIPDAPPGPNPQQLQKQAADVQKQAEAVQQQMQKLEADKAAGEADAARKKMQIDSATAKLQMEQELLDEKMAMAEERIRMSEESARQRIAFAEQKAEMELTMRKQQVEAELALARGNQERAFALRDAKFSAKAARQSRRPA